MAEFLNVLSRQNSLNVPMPRRAMIAVRGATMASAVGDRHARFNELTTGSSSSCWRLQTPFVAGRVTHGSDRAGWPSPFRKHTLSLALRHVDRISYDQTACVPPVPPPPAENWRRARGGLKNGVDPLWHLARQALPKPAVWIISVSFAMPMHQRLSGAASQLANGCSV